MSTAGDGRLVPGAARDDGPLDGLEGALFRGLGIEASDQFRTNTSDFIFQAVGRVGWNDASPIDLRGIMAFLRNDRPRSRICREAHDCLKGSAGPRSGVVRPAVACPARQEDAQRIERMWTRQALVVPRERSVEHSPYQVQRTGLPVSAEPREE